MAGNGEIKNYVCFTAEQQTYFENLQPMQRKYVEYRAQGYNKKESYEMAGYKSKNAKALAHMLEKNNAGIAELIQVLINNKNVEGILNPNSDINKTIDAIARQKSGNAIKEWLDNADVETAKRVQFYRDVANGVIKTITKTKKLDANGNVVSTTIQEVTDIDVRIKARKELDRILGLNQMVALDELECGDITINIVDASKKEELQDERNKVTIDIDKVEEINGDPVIVVEEKEEKKRGRQKNSEAN